MSINIFKTQSWKSIIIFLFIFGLTVYLISALIIIYDMDKRLDNLEYKINVDNAQMNENFENSEKFDRYICNVLKLDCIWEDEQ